MAKLPERDEIKRIYAECGTPWHVVKHCEKVADVACAIAEALNRTGRSLDVELVRCASLLHDIARVEDKHDEVAGRILLEKGYPEISGIVCDHMTYILNDLPAIDEHDVMCLSDRIVKEHEYTGVDRRVEYLIAKDPDNTKRKEGLLKWKGRIKDYIRELEKILGEPLADVVKPNASKLLMQVERPGRYIGGEVNEILKDTCYTELRMAFAFPDLYEIGMSYLGLEILYSAVNREDGIYMERAFEPAPDMAERMRASGFPLFTLETKTPLRELDVVGFTLQYEMSYTTILDMLELSGIPVLAKDRTEDDPLIIAGGPCAFSPEPLADFIDVFLIGDGETLLPEFLKRYRDAKKAFTEKEAFLETIASLEGVYVPALYAPVTDENGVLTGYEAKGENTPVTVRKAVVSDLESAPFPVDPIVPNIECVHDRAVVESFRGCTRGCRFCQAGMIYRPVRERKKETILRLAKEQIENTGHDEISLLSLSTSDHSDFEGMATGLMEYCAAHNVSLSLPSLRFDSFSFNVLNEIQKYKKSGLTFAIEAGSQRLRDALNKDITEENILSAVRQAVELGWRHIKLYFMIGLPGETKDDLDAVRDIVLKIMDVWKGSGKGGRFNITASFSNFVPKPFTPFQWCAQDSVETLDEKRAYLMEILKIKGVRYTFHDSLVSKVEAVLAKGGREVSSLLLLAHARGAVLDGWSEHFDSVLWRSVLEEWERDYKEISDRDRNADEFFPWEVIDCGVSRDWLYDEYEKSKRSCVTGDCRGNCRQCGISRIAECFKGAVR